MRDGLTGFFYGATTCEDWYLQKGITLPTDRERLAIIEKKNAKAYGRAMAVTECRVCGVLLEIKDWASLKSHILNMEQGAERGLSCSLCPPSPSQWWSRSVLFADEHEWWRPSYLQKQYSNFLWECLAIVRSIQQPSKSTARLPKQDWSYWNYFLENPEHQDEFKSCEFWYRHAARMETVEQFHEFAVQEIAFAITQDNLLCAIFGELLSQETKRRIKQITNATNNEKSETVFNIYSRIVRAIDRDGGPVTARRDQPGDGQRGRKLERQSNQRWPVVA
jgi:hypothetical protein